MGVDPGSVQDPAPAECPVCGYDRRGLTGAVCPECGADYRDAEGARGALLRAVRWWGIVGWGVVFGASAMYSVLVDRLMPNMEGWSAVFALWTSGTAALPWLLAWPAMVVRIVGRTERRCRGAVWTGSYPVLVLPLVTAVGLFWMVHLLDTPTGPLGPYTVFRMAKWATVIVLVMGVVAWVLWLELWRRWRRRARLRVRLARDVCAVLASLVASGAAVFWGMMLNAVLFNGV